MSLVLYCKNACSFISNDKFALNVQAVLELHYFLAPQHFIYKKSKTFTKIHVTNELCILVICSNMIATNSIGRVNSKEQ